MQKQLLALLLILNIVFAANVQVANNVQQGKELFQKLSKHSDIGKSLVEAVQLEIQMATQDGENSQQDQTVISKVISMIKDVQATIMAQLADIQEEEQTKRDACYENLRDLRVDIANLEERIDEIEDNVPLKQDELNMKKEELQAAQEELDFYNSQLLVLAQQDEAKKEAYEASMEEYENLQAALQQAKALIKQLKASFLQKNGSSNSFVQLSNHFEQSIQFQLKDHHRSMMKFLLQVSQAADQEQVQGLLQIIDDLLTASIESQRAEQAGELNRQSAHSTKVNRLNTQISDAELVVTQLTGEALTAEKLFEQTKESLDSSKQSLDSLNDQLETRERLCDTQVQSLTDRAQNLQEALDIITQLLIILENSSLAHSKMMVSDLDGPDNEYLDYETSSSIDATVQREKEQDSAIGV